MSKIRSRTEFVERTVKHLLNPFKRGHQKKYFLKKLPRFDIVSLAIDKLPVGVVNAALHSSADQHLCDPNVTNGALSVGTNVECLGTLEEESTVSVPEPMGFETTAESVVTKTNLVVTSVKIISETVTKSDEKPVTKTLQNTESLETLTAEDIITHSPTETAKQFVKSGDSMDIFKKPAFVVIMLGALLALILNKFLIKI